MMVSVTLGSNERCFAHKAVLIGLLSVLLAVVWGPLARQGAWAEEAVEAVAAAEDDPGMLLETAVEEIEEVAIGSAVLDEEALRGQYLLAADSAWLERDDLEKLAEAIGQYKKALAFEAQDQGIATRLSRAHHWRGERFAGELKARRQYFWTGYEWGMTALKTNAEFARRQERHPDDMKYALAALGTADVAALYWTAQCLYDWSRIEEGDDRYAPGRDGPRHKPTQKENYWQLRVRLFIDRLLDLGEVIPDTGEVSLPLPLVLAGTFHAATPRWSGGDLREAERLFQRALKINPELFITHVRLARDYAVARNDPKLFNSELDTVIQTPVDIIPSLTPEQIFAKKKAREMLHDIMKYLPDVAPAAQKEAEGIYASDMASEALAEAEDVMPEAPVEAEETHAQE
jgi:tetratricopeptide (TPR) repeat protein